MSHVIYFSSHAILNTSDEILFPTDKIGEISEKIWKNSEKIKKKAVNVKKSLRICARFVGRMILNPRRKHKFFPSLAEILTKNRSSF